MYNKCTLLIDGNWLLISRFSVMANLFRSDRSEPELNAATENLQDMMARSINIILNRFPIIDNVIFISDGGSWRKQLPIPSQLGEITYKGNREDEKSSDYSWPHIFKALSGLSKQCRNIGITTSTQSNIEGDDWAWYWSRRLNVDGTNCIIWTSDNDLKQLVQVRYDTFTAWYNDKSGLFFHTDLDRKNPEEGDLDFFMQPMYYRSPMVEALQARATKVSYIDPNSIILNKVICGDSGDNIKPVIRKVQNGRTYGVGPKDWVKIAESLNIHTVEDLINNMNEVANCLVNIKRFVGHSTPEKVVEMIEYNIKLVWLNERIEPESIVAVMNNQEYKLYDINYLRGSYTTLLGTTDEAEKIFEGIF